MHNLIRYERFYCECCVDRMTCSGSKKGGAFRIECRFLGLCGPEVKLILFDWSTRDRFSLSLRQLANKVPKGLERAMFDVVGAKVGQD
jgi:hypothetical protein